MKQKMKHNPESCYLIAAFLTSDFFQVSCCRKTVFWFWFDFMADKLIKQ